MAKEKGIVTQKNPRKRRLLAVSLALVAFVFAVQASDLQSPLTEKEKQLADLVNQYRTQSGLSSLPVTNSLTKVARAHVTDLNTNHPDTETYGTGNCNRHSWSDHGTWTPVCYTGSKEASLMWSKPREITESYEGNGYEIANWNSREATPSAAMDEWKGSSQHSDTILQRGIFSGIVWKAMGVSIDGNYAVVWFGQDADPAGPVPVALQGVTNETYAHAGMTLSATKPKYAPGETVQFVLRKVTPGSANLEEAYYEIEKEVNGEWRPYFKMDAEHWRFQTPVIEYGGAAKLFEWDQRQKGEPENKATPGPYRIKFYAPRAFDSFMTSEFAIR
jgi:uncharacterized protein YkwD